MDKQILYQYIDACELIRETEEEIRRIKRQRKRIEQDVVKGSSRDFPYTPTNFHVEGLAYTVIRDPRSLEVQEKILDQRKAAAEEIKLQVEAWLVTVPPRMQRIIRYKVFDGLTWQQVAARMGRKATADGMRKEFEKFMREN